MWKTGNCVTGVGIFSPQALCKTAQFFNRGCGRKCCLLFFHSFFLHIPQTLWKKFGVKKEGPRNNRHRLELMLAVISRMLFWVVVSPFFRAISTLRMA